MTGYGSNDLLNGEHARLRVKTCPYEYEKDNKDECVDGGYCGQPHNLPQGWFYLPHSCNEWVIGTPEQANELFLDLAAELNKVAP
jgi:hypothetical protein